MREFYMHDLDYFTNWGEYLRKLESRGMYRNQMQPMVNPEWTTEERIHVQRTLDDTIDKHWPIHPMEAAVFDQNEPYLWICGYEITRHYGGPEEGGWWYDLVTPIPEFVIQLPWETLTRNTEAGIARMVAHFDGMWRPRVASGDISSVLGGVDMHTRFEIGNTPFNHAVTERPRYE